MVDPRLFQALSDATRLEILSVLAAGPINVSKIVEHVGCAQPAVSRHLRVLREASLISDRRKGKEVEYSINLDALRAAVDHLTGLATVSASSEKGARVEKGRRPARPSAEHGKAERDKKKPGRAQRGKAEPGTAASKKIESGQAAPADFEPRGAIYTVERRPSGMDDFLL